MFSFITLTTSKFALKIWFCNIEWTTIVICNYKADITIPNLIQWLADIVRGIGSAHNRATDIPWAICVKNLTSHLCCTVQSLKVKLIFRRLPTRKFPEVCEEFGRIFCTCTLSTSRQSICHIGIRPWEILGKTGWIPECFQVQLVTCRYLPILLYWFNICGIDSSKMIRDLPKVLNPNQWFLKLNQPICNWRLDLLILRFMAHASAKYKHIHINKGKEKLAKYNSGYISRSLTSACHMAQK